jgi:hypothetical protein
LEWIHRRGLPRVREETSHNHLPVALCPELAEWV